MQHFLCLHVPEMRTYTLHNVMSDSCLPRKLLVHPCGVLSVLTDEQDNITDDAKQPPPPFKDSTISVPEFVGALTWTTTPAQLALASSVTCSTTLKRSQLSTWLKQQFAHVLTPYQRQYIVQQWMKQCTEEHLHVEVYANPPVQNWEIGSRGMVSRSLTPTAWAICYRPVSQKQVVLVPETVLDKEADDSVLEVFHDIHLIQLSLLRRE